MATTISRTWYDTLIDDDGSGTTGSVWDKADVDAILDAVDAILANDVVFGSSLTASNLIATNAVGSASLEVVSAVVPDANATIELRASPTGAAFTLIDFTRTGNDFLTRLYRDNTGSGPFSFYQTGDGGFVFSHQVGIGTVNKAADHLHIRGGRLRVDTDSSGGSFLVSAYGGTTRVTSAASGGGGSLSLGREPVAVHGQLPGNYDVSLYSGANGSTLTLMAKGGFVGIGTDTPAARLGVVETTGGVWTTIVTAANANPYGLQLVYANAAPNASGNMFLHCTDTGGPRMEVRSNGGIANYQSNDVNYSDARLKRLSAVPVPTQCDRLARLQVVLGRYLDAPGAANDLMLTAQQVQTVYPELVEPTSVHGPLGIRTYGVLLHLLKGVQELIARVDALEATTKGAA